MRTHYNPPTPTTSTAAVVSAPGTLYLGSSYRSNLWFWVGISMLAHLLMVGLTALIIAILQFFGFNIPLFDSLAMKPRDMEFVIVDNSPVAPPRDPNTKNRAERMSRSGGQKTAVKHQAIPQRAAGTPSPKPQPSPRPQPQARPQPQPQPQPRVAQATPAPRPTPRPVQPRNVTPPTPQPTPQPTPRPAPPAPRATRPTQIASHTAPTLPPNPTAPIRTPAPPNPGISGGGPVVRTPGPVGGGSTSGGSSGTPGPSMIAGRPGATGGHTGGGASGGGGRPSGGSGGTGAYNQAGSPGGGGGRAGIDALPEPDFGPYIAELQRRIRKNWNPPTADRSKRVVALFTIGKDGRLLGYRIKQSSGTDVADKAALAAITASAPFRPLPTNYRGNDIDVEFIFDYEIYGPGGSIRRQ